MRSLFTLFREIIKNRKMVLELAKADFRKRFVGSYFGVIWMFIQPLVTIAIYAFIFGEHGMKNAPPVPNASYVIWLAPGIIPWFYFSEALNTGTNTLQEYSYLVKKVVFKVELLPVIKLISCFMVHLCFLVIMFGLYLLTDSLQPSTPAIDFRRDLRNVRCLYLSCSHIQNNLGSNSMMEYSTLGRTLSMCFVALI